MSDDPNCGAICKEISEEVAHAAQWLSGEGLTPNQFREALCELEGRKLKRFGLTLDSVVAEDGVVHLTLRFKGTQEFCASMDIRPDTGSITTQHSCV